MRLLFVDDEPAILDAFQGLLRRHRKQWDMVFACGPIQAMHHLEQGAFDVVVSDMLMPGMDGATLLGKVKDLSPSTVRVILSGQAEREVVLRALPVAHQFLDKPCDADTLRRVIARACELRSRVTDEELLSVLGGIDRLPSPPKLYYQLTRALANPNTTMDGIGRLVAQDPSISAKLLQLVNSAYFGSKSQPVASVERAVRLLGVDIVRGLVVSAHLMSELERAPKVNGFDYDALAEHALLVARVAQRLVAGARQGQEAFTAALLHDLGKVVLALASPDRPDPDGCDHALIGGYLLGLWGLPPSIVEAVALHHHPASAEGEGVELATTIHLADGLVHEITDPTQPSRLDEEFLAKVGMAPRLPELRTVALEEVKAWRPQA